MFSEAFRVVSIYRGWAVLGPKEAQWGLSIRAQTVP